MTWKRPQKKQRVPTKSSLLDKKNEVLRIPGIVRVPRCQTITDTNRGYTYIVGKKEELLIYRLTNDFSDTKLVDFKERLRIAKFALPN